MTRTLTVWWEGAVVGSLALDADGQMQFTYAEEWLAADGSPALSCSLPKHREPFRRRRCRSFFGGLLPEGDQRESVARVLGVSPDNEFGLLERLGGDVAGALTLWPEGETPPLHEPQHQTKALSDEGLVALLEALPASPFLAGAEGRLRLSLAGAQSKMPVVLVGSRVALPEPGQPTTHILKPSIDRFPATVENEAFAMRLAARLGLSVAAVEPRSVAGLPYLLVERYDRHLGADGRVVRLHQEDFCQALGLAAASQVRGRRRTNGRALFRACSACLQPARCRGTQAPRRIHRTGVDRQRGCSRQELQSAVPGRNGRTRPLVRLAVNRGVSGARSEVRDEDRRTPDVGRAEHRGLGPIRAHGGTRSAVRAPTGTGTGRAHSGVRRFGSCRAVAAGFECRGTRRMCRPSGRAGAPAGSYRVAPLRALAVAAMR